MSQEDSINALIESANIHLARADKISGENPQEALNEIYLAVDDLSRAGSSIISEITKGDVVLLDGTVAKVLRKLAEDSELIPGNFSQTVNALPNADDILGAQALEISTGSLSAEKIVDTVKNVYETPGSKLTDAEGDFSALNIIKDLLLGNRKLSETVFSENGVYDIFVSSTTPYLVTAASFISRDEEKFAEFENMIPEALNGPVKHLSKLLLSLLTSAFMSGLLILIVKRIIAGSGTAKNVMFGASVVSLTISNLPLIVEGVKAVSAELSELKRIVFEKKN